MIDIITVVFGEEIPVLRCQAQGIDLYCQDLGVRSIYVMINDVGISHQIDPAWWGSMADRVRIMPRETFSCDWKSNGWLTQQVLKLQAAAISNNVWSMVLDAKTVIVRPLDQNLLLNDNGGSVNFGWEKISPVFYPALDIANKLFGVSNDEILMPAGVPFFFHNASVRSMIVRIEAITGVKFADWFQDQGMATEFVLYSKWIESQNLHALYAKEQVRPLEICHICHQDAGRFDELIDSYGDQIHILSVHRRTWTQLSMHQREKFRTRMISRGITMAGSLL